MAMVEDDFEAPLAEASAMITLDGGKGVAEYERRARRRKVPLFPIHGEHEIDATSAQKIAREVVEKIERITAGSSTPDRTPA